jgi:hypothetical protein
MFKDATCLRFYNNVKMLVEMQHLFTTNRLWLWWRYVRGDNAHVMITTPPTLRLCRTSRVNREGLVRPTEYTVQSAKLFL